MARATGGPDWRPLIGFDHFQLNLELLAELVDLSAPETIATATSKAAEAIGSSDFDVLAPGKQADVLAVRGNAVDDIRAPQRPAGAQVRSGHGRPR
ncbi:MAG TPA: hypothetical protein VFV93_00285 [Thermomicrobiales bacterium]|nr:hypothetical protein [Thermomicrobiales bacterium]